MTNGLTSPKATDRPPGPTPQAARGAPPPSDAFAGMLDAHQARTAIAEGQSQKPERPAHDAAKPAASEDQHDAPATVQDDCQDDDDKAAAEAAVLAAALPMPIEVSTTAAVTEAAPAATQMVVAGGAPTPVVQVVTPVQAEVPAVAPVLPEAAAAVATAPVAATP